MSLKVHGIGSPESKGFSIEHANRVLSVLVLNRVSYAAAVDRAAGVLETDYLWIDSDLRLGPDSVACFQVLSANGFPSSLVLTLVCCLGVLSEAYLS